MNKFIVITTINSNLPAIECYKQMSDWQIVVVGDKKSTRIESKGNLIYLSVEDQKNLEFELIEFLPFNHYSRKNIGYLYAIKEGADIIYDTDDDNFPTSDWQLPDFHCNRMIVSSERFVNVYKYFTRYNVWPRGFPLDEIKKYSDDKLKTNMIIDIGILQGLVDIDPDVDAIYRLTVNKKIIFDKHPQLAIDKGCYCPFNSQNTFWIRNIFPCLYLPVSVTFRFTDILRSYIAQRLMWVDDLRIGFSKAVVYQERNIHNLMVDFEQEIECYLKTKAVVDILESIDLNSNQPDNLLMVYKMLNKKGLVGNMELETCSAWIRDFKRLTAKTLKEQRC